MKKIYSTPEVAIVNVELQSMIAFSGDPNSSFDMNDPDRDLEDNIVSGNLSRGGSLWDDED